MQTSVGQLLINEHLPEDLRDYDRVLDKRGINTLLRNVAQRYPERYREISHALNTIGWRTAQETGGYSFGMEHLRPAKAALALRQKLQAQMQTILADDSLDDKTREDRIVKLAGGMQKQQQEDVFNESLAEKNPLAYQVLSGSRGNKMNLASLRGSDMLYADHRDNVIPVPVLRSYSEGLSPWEYWAGTYGARKGVMDVKFATQDAGFLSKQLNQVTHRLVVEALDRDGDGVPDTNPRGLPVDTDDTDNEGALLAQDVGPYKRNTVLSPKILNHLKQLGKERILVRSPTVGGSQHGGIYARDAGVREHGTLPGRGEFPGLAAVQALSEPLTQAQISSKHTGGVAGEGKAISGFDYVNQLVQVPKRFKHGATHSEEDGVVGRILPAPAGGNYIYINGKEHYIPDGIDLKVKPGDRVEAGDAITTGLPNPAKIVEHKGVGEGRRYFVKAFRDAMGGAGMTANRRNIELLSRGLINHVRLTDEMGDYVHDDLVPYHAIEHAYKPRDDSAEVEPTLAQGQYLESPVLHYTIGTRVRPSVMKDLQEFGVNKIRVHRDPPPFQPEMVRGMSSLTNDPDWMTRMYGSGLKGGLLKAVHRGGTSDEKGTSFVPSLARAVDFGRTPGGMVRKPDPGWKPEPPPAIKFGSSLGVPGGPAAGDAPGAGNVGGLPGGVKPLGSTPLAQPSAQAKPQFTQPAQQPQQPQQPQQQYLPSTQGAEPTARPWFSDYQPPQSGGMTQTMMSNLLPYAPQFGPLAPLALMAGIDFNGLGTLTRGKNWSQQANYTQQLNGQPEAAPQSPVATTPQPPAAATPSQAPAPHANVAQEAAPAPTYPQPERPSGFAQTAVNRATTNPLARAGGTLGTALADPTEYYRFTGALPGVGPLGRPLLSAASLPWYGRAAQGAANTVGRSVVPSLPALAITAPLQAGATAAYYMTPEGGGGYGAANDAMRDWTGETGWWGKVKNYNPLSLPGTAMRDAMALTHITSNARHLNSPVTQSQEQVAGIDPRNDIELKQQIAAPNLSGSFMQNHMRRSDIENRDVATAQDPREARNWAMQWDPTNVQKMEQQLQQKRQQEPEADYDIDWSQNRVNDKSPSTWGVIRPRNVDHLDKQHIASGGTFASDYPELRADIQRAGYNPSDIYVVNTPEGVQLRPAAGANIDAGLLAQVSRENAAGLRHVVGPYAPQQPRSDPAMLAPTSPAQAMPVEQQRYLQDPRVLANTLPPEKRTDFLRELAVMAAARQGAAPPKSLREVDAYQRLPRQYTPQQLRELAIILAEEQRRPPGARPH